MTNAERMDVPAPGEGASTEGAVASPPFETQRPTALDGYAGLGDALEVLRKPASASWIPALVLSLAAFVYVRQSETPVRQAIVIAGILLVHELGHVVAMRLLGYRDVRVLFIPLFGALTTARSGARARWKQAVVALAGPLPGLGFAAVVFLSPLHADARWWDIAWTAVLVNGFNLLPVGFLDGGRVLDELVFQRNRVLEAAFASLSAVAFLAFAAATTDWMLVGIGVLSLVAVPHAYKRAQAAARLKGKLGDGEVTTLPAFQLDVLYAEALELTGANGKPRTRADTMRDLHARATTPPASWRATLGLSTLWLGSVLAALVLAFVGVRPTLSRAPPVASAGGPTTPSFGWEAGTRAKVLVRRHSERVRDGQSTVRKSMNRTGFTVSASEGGGLSVVFDEGRGEVRAADPGARFTEAVGAHGFGEIDVTATGEVEDIQLTAEVEAALEAVLAAEAPGAPDTRALKERSLLTAARTPMLELWQYSVGVVPRKTLRPGVDEVVAAGGTNPLTGKAVGNEFTYRLEGRVPCRLGETDARCVLLSYRFTYDTVEVARQARELAARAAGGPPPAEAQLELSSSGFVVYEEATLFPRLAYRSRTQRWRGADPWETTEQVRFEIDRVH